ncbi:cytochrome c [Aliivibrio finisterrensis]|uniref:Cytochrome c n=2 Tax=Vibrionaceae TaxID=641 RepID=A0A4Q5KWL9_9GAMM|nr:cytochrome c [Aliivibrio finisterrensis]RYU51712.1 cytochrome c [Aliivibrio finisterrensis]RYU53186.1 cytochrome c [Aliivibrio finisterrensis]RYU58644.1 cytochrome c [Aliivibrio finisterrensis]RYU64819.1 cytochrome c [Aliivibrio finisterrensis]
MEAEMKKIGLITLLSLSAVAADYAQEIEARQDNFQYLDATVDLLDDAFDKEVLDWNEIMPLAQSAHLTVEEQKTLFPEGSADNSRARTKIWAQKAEFEGKFDTLSQQFILISEAAVEQDDVAARAALDKAFAQCRSCHMNYRSLW